MGVRSSAFINRRMVRARWRPYTVENDEWLSFLWPSPDAIGMQSSFQAQKRKAPQGHKALQGNLFLQLGRVGSNHQPPG